jgi:hypothetical protein
MVKPTATPAKLTGTFEVRSWTEDTWQGADGEVKLSHVTGTQRFEGDIVGDGSVAWLMCYLPEGSARFVGLQRIDGRVGARRGSVVLESIGDHDGASSTGSWKVVPGSGAGELAGATGRGGFQAPGGKTVEYELELTEN